MHVYEIVNERFVVKLKNLTIISSMKYWYILHTWEIVVQLVDEQFLFRLKSLNNVFIKVNF